MKAPKPDRQGNLYVSKRSEGTIREFSRNGDDLGYFATGMVSPLGLAFSPKPGDEEDDTSVN